MIPLLAGCYAEAICRAARPHPVLLLAAAACCSMAILVGPAFSTLVTKLAEDSFAMTPLGKPTPGINPNLTN